MIDPTGIQARTTRWGRNALNHRADRKTFRALLAKLREEVGELEDAVEAIFGNAPTITHAAIGESHILLTTSEEDEVGFEVGDVLLVAFAIAGILEVDGLAYAEEKLAINQNSIWVPGDDGRWHRVKHRIEYPADPQGFDDAKGN